MGIAQKHRRWQISSMVAYSFKPMFRGPILAGIKTQTIRADRRRHAREGEAISLFTGMRTRNCRKIGDATCAHIQPVTIDLPANGITLDGRTLQGWEDLDAMAHRDGFDGWLAMRAFWHENHPKTPVFSGWLIRWANFKPATET